MGVDKKLQSVVQSMYDRPTFKVEVEGFESEWHSQETGIRQGCQFSPYLFLTVMTVLVHDVHEHDSTGNMLKKISGANFIEVLYADATIILSTDTRTINKCLRKLGLKVQNTDYVSNGTSAR